MKNNLRQKYIIKVWKFINNQRRVKEKGSGTSMQQDFRLLSNPININSETRTFC